MYMHLYNLLYNAVIFNPDSQISMETVSHLEEIGITNIRELEAEEQQLFLAAIGVDSEEFRSILLTL